jgi:hypothetical protein
MTEQQNDPFREAVEALHVFPPSVVLKIWLSQLPEHPLPPP